MAAQRQRVVGDIPWFRRFIQMAFWRNASQLYCFLAKLGGGEFNT
jgi:hypothetical protein